MLSNVALECGRINNNNNNSSCVEESGTVESPVGQKESFMSHGSEEGGNNLSSSQPSGHPPPSSPVGWPHCSGGVDGCGLYPCTCLTDGTMERLDNNSLMDCGVGENGEGGGECEQEVEVVETIRRISHGSGGSVGYNNSNNNNHLWHHPTPMPGQWTTPLEVSTGSSAESGWTVDRRGFGGNSSTFNNSCIDEPSTVSGGRAGLVTIVNNYATLSLHRADKRNLPHQKRDNKLGRHTFSEHQLKILKQAFAQDDYPNDIVRKALALQLGLTDTNIKNWFQNRRCARKRKRLTVINHSPQVLSQLEKVFAHYHYPSTVMKYALSQKTGLSGREIESWFTVRRGKWSKANKDEYMAWSQMLPDRDTMMNIYKAHQLIPEHQLQWAKNWSVASLESQRIKQQQQQHQEPVGRIKTVLPSLLLNPTSRPVGPTTVVNTVTGPRAAPATTTTTAVPSRGNYSPLQPAPPVYFSTSYY